MRTPRFPWEHLLNKTAVFDLKSAWILCAAGQHEMSSCKLYPLDEGEELLFCFVLYFLSFFWSGEGMCSLCLTFSHQACRQTMFLTGCGKKKSWKISLSEGLQKQVSFSKEKKNPAKLGLVFKTFSQNKYRFQNVHHPWPFIVTAFTRRTQGEGCSQYICQHGRLKKSPLKQAIYLHQKKCYGQNGVVNARRRAAGIRPIPLEKTPAKLHAILLAILREVSENANR